MNFNMLNFDFISKNTYNKVNYTEFIGEKGTGLEFITNIDNGVIEIIQNNIQGPILDKIMPIISNLGDMVVWLLITVVFVCTKKYRKHGIVMLIALGLCMIFGSFGIKNIVRRVRPCNVYDTLNLIISKPDGYSFPSGHSMRSFAAAVVILKTDKKFGIPALILAFLTAFSRVYLYAHYFTDVLVGGIIGATFALITYKILMDNKRINELLRKTWPLLWRRLTNNSLK